MLIGLLVVSILLQACGGAVADPESLSPAEAPSAAVGRFEGLTIRLDLDASSVSSGEEVGSRLTVRNDSGETIVDPSCLIGGGAYALVPADDPDADLWLQPVVDCSGSFEMPDGYVDHSDGPTFPARTQQGEPLPPGDYLATLEIEGYPERIQEPIAITD